MIGYIIVMTYCLAVAFSAILIQEGSADTSLVILAGSFVGILFYGIINYKHLKELVKKLKKHPKNILGINIATTIGWLFGYVYGLEYIDAPTLFCIEMATIPIVNFVASTPIHKYSKRIPTLIAILCSIISMSLIIWQNILLGQEAKSYLVGTCMGILAGIGTAYIGIFSEKLTQNDFSSSAILMFRLLCLFPISLLLSFKRNAFAHLSFQDLKIVLLSGIMTGIFTSFLYQKSLQKLGATIVSTLVPFTPVCAYFMRMYLGKQPFNLYVFLTILFCSAMICSMNILMKKRQKTN